MTKSSQSQRYRIPEELASSIRIAGSDDGAGLRSAVEAVTLVVYGWEHVEPGTLSWIFPSVDAALRAVQTMKNAIQWAIVSGGIDSPFSLETVRAAGVVLYEQS